MALPSLALPSLPAAAPASAQRARSQRRCHCRTCHHVAAAGSCLTLSGPRFPISRCPPSLVAVCSAAPRGRPLIPKTLTWPSRQSRPSGGCRRVGPGMLHPVQLRQRCPRCAFLLGTGLNGGQWGARLGDTLERTAAGGGGCSGCSCVGGCGAFVFCCCGLWQFRRVREEGIGGGGLAPSEQ